MTRTSLLALALPLASVLACDRSGEKQDPSAASGLAVKVDGAGYHPDELKAKGGETVRVTFTRVSDKGCGEKLVFPELEIEKDLPLNVAVPVEVTMPASGKIAFTCGMDMYRGAIVAE